MASSEKTLTIGLLFKEIQDISLKKPLILIIILMI